MIEALETISCECFRSFGVLRNAVVLEGDVCGVITDVPLTFFNGIGFARTTEARIGEIVELYRARGRSFRWWVTPNSQPPNLGELLTAHGITHAYDSAGMTADLARIAPVPRVDIRRVRNDAEMDVFGDVLTTVFERPKSDAALWRIAYGQCGYDDPSPWAHFIAWDDETPAATASVLLCGEVAGIYLVGTLAEARGKGLGTAVTLAAMHHGRERGARVAALQSSAMGESVYRAMGFVSHGTLPMYEWRYNAAP